MFEFKLFSGSSLIPEILPSLRLSRKRKGIPQKKKEELLEDLIAKYFEEKNWY